MLKQKSHDVVRGSSFRPRAGSDARRLPFLRRVSLPRPPLSRASDSKRAFVSLSIRRTRRSVETARRDGAHLGIASVRVSS